VERSETLPNSGGSDAGIARPPCGDGILPFKRAGSNPRTTFINSEVQNVRYSNELFSPDESLHLFVRIVAIGARVPLDIDSRLAISDARGQATQFVEPNEFVCSTVNQSSQCNRHFQ
jgi:hypothetical protein